KGERLTARAVLVASGSKRRALEAEGAADFENKGLTYCASCDGPMFAGTDVAVIGGGNAALETAAQLLAYAKSVTIIQRSDRFKADPITVEKVTADPKLTVLLNTEITKVEGDKFVGGLALKNTETGAESSLSVAGVFV